FVWMDYVGYDPIVIATKADKIKRSQLDKQIKLLREGLGASKETIIVTFSSQTKQGLDTIQDFLDQVIENEASLSDVQDLD
ncbi:MAG: YihA family ribosome biogenesis GTP-binding protein, partial [Pseudobutyrivibrio sp.]|nr:YihA family ribosome biogenesis GTP-binding protein [Pseudobutyrivibrio sp.]